MTAAGQKLALDRLINSTSALIMVGRNRDQG